MRKVKLIVHEKYEGKQNSSNVFAAVFLSDTAALTLGESPGILNNTPSKAGGFCVNLKLAQAEARFRGLKVTLRLKPFSQT